MNIEQIGLSGKASNLDLGGTLFESRPDIDNTDWRFSWFLSASPDKCLDSISN
jgi:hypothetical protein